MIHIIYIYFIVNAFLAGRCWGDDKDLKLTIIALFLGSLVPIVIFLHWIDRKTEFRTLLALIFTNYYKNDVDVDFLKEMYESSNWYKRWVIRMIDKKYNYGITKEVQDDF